MDRLPLGEYIARSGYDWTAENHADVNVALDLEMQQVMITVSGWDGVGENAVMEGVTFFLVGIYAAEDYYYDV